MKLLFGEELKLVSIDPVKNRYRYYHIYMMGISEQLFLIKRTWGRFKKDANGDPVIGKITGGGSKTMQYNSYERALYEFEAILNNRINHDYRVLCRDC